MASSGARGLRDDIASFRRLIAKQSADLQLVRDALARIDANYALMRDTASAIQRKVAALSRRSRPIARRHRSRDASSAPQIPVVLRKRKRLSRRRETAGDAGNAHPGPGLWELDEAGHSDLARQWLQSGLADPHQQLRLLLRTSLVRRAEFHEACDGTAPTLVLIQTANGSVFGGFRPYPWESWSAELRRSEFLFILRSPKVAEPVKLGWGAGAKWKRPRGAAVSFGADDVWVSEAEGGCNFPMCFSGVPDRSYFDGTADGRFGLVAFEVWRCVPARGR